MLQLIKCGYQIHKNSFNSIKLPAYFEKILNPIKIKEIELSMYDLHDYTGKI